MTTLPERAQDVIAEMRDRAKFFRVDADDVNGWADEIEDALQPSVGGEVGTRVERAEYFSPTEGGHFLRVVYRWPHNGELLRHTQFVELRSKDQVEHLIALLLTSPAQPNGFVLVPVEIVSFLLGEGRLDGVWYGDKPQGSRPFWWRDSLRRSRDVTAAPSATDDVAGGG